MAITFDAVDDIINCSSTTSIENLQSQGGGGMSISFWAKPTGGGEGGIGTFICKDQNGSTGNWFVGHDSSSDEDTITFGKDFDGASNVFVQSSASTVTRDSWQHFIITWDGSITATNVHIYKNNSEITYGTQTDGAGSAVSDSIRSLCIGNNSNGARTFQGDITEVAVWNKVLSSTEIAKLYGSGSPLKGTPLFIGFGDSLRGYWPMNESPNGATVNSETGFVRDRSGLSNHGTQTGSPVYFTESLALPSKPASYALNRRG